MQIPEFNRKSKLYRYEQLDPNIRFDLEQYAESMSLRTSFALDSLCSETLNVPVIKEKVGLLRNFLARSNPQPGHQEHTVVAVPTSAHLFLHVRRADTSRTILCGKYADMSAELPSRLPTSSMGGLYVTCRWIGGTEPSSYFLPLDAGPAGATFRETLLNRIAAG